MTLAYIIVATTTISLISLIGIFTLALKHKLLEKITFFLVALSAGALMGGAFLDLLPEAAERLESERLYLIVIISFILFYLIEKILHWRHCHEGECPVHIFGYINLLGDTVHNFIDGLVIAASFAVDIRLGVVTTLAIALHEIPQEIGDFAVLVYAGFEKQKALLMNFLTALSAILGGFLGYYLSTILEPSVKYLLPFAAGGFIYIAASDLLPEIKKETDLLKSLISFGVFVLGILIIYLVGFVGG